MTAQPTTITDVQRLEDLAVAWLNEQWTTACEIELTSLAAIGPAEETWQAFEDLCDAVRLRNGLDDPTVHWSEVNDALTGSDRSESAWQIACQRADDAARALLNGRQR
jgi:hypothetical protein